MLTPILQLLALGYAGAMSVDAHAGAMQVPVGAEADADTAAAPPGPSAQGLRKRRGYLAGIPGIVGFALSRKGSLPAMYLWGIEGGTNFPIGRAFLVQAGGFFEHSPYRQTVSNPLGPTSVQQHWLRLGPQVRIGGGNEHIFGYALLSLVVDGRITRSFTFEEGNALRRFVLLAHGAIGGGVQGLIAGKVILGGEAILDAWLPMFMRARLYVGVMF